MKKFATIVLIIGLILIGQFSFAADSVTVGRTAVVSGTAEAATDISRLSTYRLSTAYLATSTNPVSVNLMCVAGYKVVVVEYLGASISSFQLTKAGAPVLCSE